MIAILKERPLMSTTMPICPLLSIRNVGFNELCLGEECALFLPAAKKCSLIYIGFNAFMQAQRLQQQPQQGIPPQQ
jgi:hypothetical protein